MAIHAKTNIQLNTIPANTSLLGGHFVYNSTALSPNTLQGANVIENVSVDPAEWGYNTHIGANGIQLRLNEEAYTVLDMNGLTVSKGGIKGGEAEAGHNKFVYLSTEDYPLKNYLVNPHIEGLTINGFTPTAEGTDGRTEDDYAWREVIGSNFGVTSDGSLYANNASITGAITATSLMISGGSGSSTYVYDGNSAINATSYSIEIIEDRNAKPEGSFIIEEQTYLYPIMYLNGQSVMDEYKKTEDTEIVSGHIYYIRSGVEGDYIYIKVNNPDIADITMYYERVYPLNRFVWYYDDISVVGDTIHGGIIATYGKAYRVTYELEDDAVGHAETVQTIYTDDVRHITDINSNGITIHPEVVNGNYIQLDTNGLEIYKNNESIAQYSNIIRIGKDEAERFVINSGSLEAYDNNNNKYFEVSANGTTARIGILTSSRFEMSANSLAGYNSNNVKYFEVSDNNLQFGSNAKFVFNNGSLQAFNGDTKYFEVSANGLSWGNGNNPATVAQVEAAAQTATNYIKIDGNGIKIQNSSDGTDYLFIDSSKIAFYRNSIEKMQVTDSNFRLGDTSNYINLNTNGLQLYKSGSKIADFGATINFYAANNKQIGKISNEEFSLSGSRQYIDSVNSTHDTAGLLKYSVSNNKTDFQFRGTYKYTVPDDNTIDTGEAFLEGNAGTARGAASIAMRATGTTETVSNNSSVTNNAVVSCSAMRYGGTTNGKASVSFVGDEVTTSTAITVVSDKRLKTHISYLDEDKSKSNFISKLKPVYFFKDKFYHLGFYAQDVAENDPWNCLTRKMDDGYLALNYTEMMAPLVAYCQHLEERIKQLEEKE